MEQKFGKLQRLSHIELTDFQKAGSNIEYHDVLYWSKEYEKRYKRNTRAKIGITVIAGTLLGTIGWLASILRSAVEKRDMQYMFDVEVLPTYCLMLACIFAGLGLFLFQWRLVTTELIDNIREITGSSKNIHDTFKLLQNTLFIENLVQLLSLLSHDTLLLEARQADNAQNFKKKIIKILKFWNSEEGLQKLRTQIVKVFKEKEFHEMTNRNEYNLKISINKLNKLLVVLLKYKYSYLILKDNSSIVRHNAEASNFTSCDTHNGENRTSNSVSKNASVLESENSRLKSVNSRTTSLRISDSRFANSSATRILRRNSESEICRPTTDNRVARRVFSGKIAMIEVLQACFGERPIQFA